MIGNIGLMELLVIAALGLIVFGPDRLPKAAADAARMIRQLKQVARGVVKDVQADLGPEFSDLDVASMHPRKLVGSIFDED